jgi:DHA2 family multidrug resistance protein
MSCFFLGMLTISLDRIPPEKLPSATGVSNFSRIIAGSFAASITTTLWDRREALHQGRLAEAVGREPPVQAAIEALQALGLSATQATAAVYRQLVNQSYLLATTDLFWLSAVLAGALIVLLWTTRRPQMQGGPVAAD